MVIPRLAARALVTDPLGRVLLIRIHDEIALDATDPVRDYWITVGGGVEAGETFEDAIVREVFEETGHRITASGPCIWRRQRELTDAAGNTRRSDERYFWCPLESAHLDAANLTDFERDVIREFRWWDLADPDLARARIFPAGFIAAARTIIENGPPEEPTLLA